MIQWFGSTQLRRNGGRGLWSNQLYKNLTELLPLRIIGGTEKDIPEYRLKSLKQERNPVPKNGAAAELFASDLLAVSSGELALPHEEREKELLRIGERFGLRGPEIDKLNTASLAESRRKTVEQSLEQLKSMTLTVVDGDFPRGLLSKHNLTFAEYSMPAKRNSPASYDAKLNKPAPKEEGILKVGAVADFDDEARVAEVSPISFPRVLTRLLLSLLIALIGVSVVFHGGRVNISESHCWFWRARNLSKRSRVHDTSPAFVSTAYRGVVPTGRYPWR